MAFSRGYDDFHGVPWTGTVHASDQHLIDNWASTTTTTTKNIQSYIPTEYIIAKTSGSQAMLDKPPVPVTTHTSYYDHTIHNDVYANIPYAKVAQLDDVPSGIRELWPDDSFWTPEAIRGRVIRAEQAELQAAKRAKVMLRQKELGLKRAAAA